MKLTNKGRYAVMAMAKLLQMLKIDLLAFQISSRQNISLAYLEQIFSSVKK